MLRLKENLLIDVLSPRTEYKYSKSILNLKTIIALEKQENFKIPESIITMYNKVLKQETDFINGIPLTIVERYYIGKQDKLNSYLNIAYKDSELNIQVNQLLMLLEIYYTELYLIASLLASFYNLEIKINNKNNDTDFV